MELHMVYIYYYIPNVSWLVASPDFTHHACLIISCTQAFKQALQRLNILGTFIDKIHIESELWFGKKAI